MIDPRRLAFDFDGVLADTMHLYLDILKNVYAIDHIAYSDITQYDLEACLDIDPAIIQAVIDRIIEGNYAGSLKPIKGAVEVLKRLHAFGPIRLVTARPYPGPIPAWLDSLLPTDEYQIEITPTGSFEAKAQKLKSAEINFFVEDRLATCFLLQEQGIKPILYVQPWNRRPHPFTEVDGWSQLDALINWT